MNAAPIDQVLRRAEETAGDALATLSRLVAQPSVSARNEGVRECAALVREVMEQAGIRTDLMETEGHPAVYGEAPGPAGAPTILFYGHYDVQPPDPTELWESAPFQATLRNGRIYGRGVADNKGQFLCHVWAVRAWRDTSGHPPVSVRFLIEGEEETGSPHLEALARAHRDRLRTDLVFTADGGMDPSGRPTIYFGARGILYVEIEIRGAAADAHSGRFGNVLPQPAWELVRLLASLREEYEHAGLPGFSGGVVAPTPAETNLLRQIPFDRAAILQESGLGELDVTDGAEYHRRLAFEPTFNIAGLHSGYAGPGMKTIIPSRAVAKIDFRLVADQDPERIFQSLKDAVAQRSPQAEVRRLAAVPPSRTDPASPLGRTVIDAVRASWDRDPVVIPVFGGTLPDYVFTRVLGVPSIIVPYANHDEQNHAPNENLRLECFSAGIRTTIFVLDALGRHKP